MCYLLLLLLLKLQLLDLELFQPILFHLWHQRFALGQLLGFAFFCDILQVLLLRGHRADLTQIFYHYGAKVLLIGIGVLELEALTVQSFQEMWVVLKRIDQVEARFGRGAHYDQGYDARKCFPVHGHGVQKQ